MCGIRTALRLAVASAVTSLFAIPLCAQTFFYNEVAKDGRIYVFAIAAKYEEFTKNGTQTGPVIERQKYGPGGETVVFDSQDAVNLYNFKQDFQERTFPARSKTPTPNFLSTSSAD